MRGLLVVLCLLTAPAWAGTVVGIVYNAQGAVVMVVVPDDDGELDDSAYHPDGTDMARVPLATFMNTWVGALPWLVPSPPGPKGDAPRKPPPPKAPVSPLPIDVKAP